MATFKKHQGKTRERKTDSSLPALTALFSNKSQPDLASLRCLEGISNVHKAEEVLFFYLLSKIETIS